MMVLAEGNSIVIIGLIVETADAYVANDLVTPKHVMTNPRLVDALIPKDYVSGKFILSDKGLVIPDPNAIPEPVPVEEVTLEDVISRLSIVESKVGVTEAQDATSSSIKS